MAEEISKHERSGNGVEDCPFVICKISAVNPVGAKIRHKIIGLAPLGCVGAQVPTSSSWPALVTFGVVAQTGNDRADEPGGIGRYDDGRGPDL